MNWWQELPLKISPYLFQLNGFQVRYYSLMYMAAFASVYWLVAYRLKTEPWHLHKELVYDFFVWAAVGVILGGRFGYVVFYNFSYFLDHPLEIFLPFGMYFPTDPTHTLRHPSQLYEAFFEGSGL